MHFHPILRNQGEISKNINLIYGKLKYTKVFKCTEYKTFKKLIKYENKHTHPGKKYDASVSIVKHKMKNEIRKTSIPFDINPKHIYNEISEEIGLICPKYNSIKSQISRYNKKKTTTS
ncbi:hypothetical protein H8356DRAFT_1323758 [Neocallimastix lanati (nom. inval.)]|nr:hypothetical protein H8356DRAFT_1323758 [Neocallimastix sp. JGI-2020a]